jgi:hypothetical protein
MDRFCPLNKKAPRSRVPKNQPHRTGGLTGVPGERSLLAGVGSPPHIYGDDLDSPDETYLSPQFDRPVMVHRYPAASKAFYMQPDPADPSRPLCVDVLARSSHLYQLMTYLRNLEASLTGQEVEGLLVYPRGTARGTARFRKRHETVRAPCQSLYDQFGSSMERCSRAHASDHVYVPRRNLRTSQSSFGQQRHWNEGLIPRPSSGQGPVAPPTPMTQMQSRRVNLPSRRAPPHGSPPTAPAKSRRPSRPTPPSPPAPPAAPSATFPASRSRVISTGGSEASC